MKTSSLILLLCGITNVRLTEVCNKLANSAFIIAKDDADFKVEIPKDTLLFCHHLSLIYEIKDGSISTSSIPKSDNTTRISIDRTKYSILHQNPTASADSFKCIIKIEGNADEIVLEGTESFVDGKLKGTMLKNGVSTNIQLLIGEDTWKLADKGIKLFTDKLIQVNHDYETSSTLILVQSSLLGVGLVITLAFIMVKIIEKLKKEADYTTKVE